MGIRLLSARRYQTTARVLALAMAFDALIAIRPAQAAPADIFDIGAPVIGAEPPKAAKIPEGDASVSQTGAAQYSFPIAVPPGRLGVEPHLSLSYSSQGPIYSGIAAGWSLSIPLITLDTSHGRMDDAVNNGTNRRYTSSLSGGRPLVQVVEPANGHTPFRAKNDSSFTRYQRISTNGVAPPSGSAYWWVAYSTDGTAYYFGDTDAHTSSCAGMISDVYAPLTRTVDPFGNTVDYWWEPGASNECRIASITWGENANASIGAFAAVKFGYASELRTCAGIPVGSQSSYRTGSPIVTGASKLDVITAVAFPPLTYSSSGYNIPQTVDYTRTITLGYDENAMTGMSGQVSCFRQLNSIAEGASGTNVQTVSLPPVTFTYGPAVLIYPSELATTLPWATVSDPNPYNLGWGYRNLSTTNDQVGVSGGGWPTVESMMLDIDGDGLLDRVTAASTQETTNYVYNGSRQICAAKWFRNRGATGFDPSARWIILPTAKWSAGSGPTGPERCSLNYQFTKYKNSFASVTSAINKLCPDTCSTLGYAAPCPTSGAHVGTCGNGQDCFGLPMQDTTLSYRWVDIDGDGLVDVVASIAEGGLYRLQRGVSNDSSGCNQLSEPAIFGTWGDPLTNPNYPLPACPADRYSGVLYPGYSMCGGMTPWFIYKNHGNGNFGRIDPNTGYGPVPDSFFYQPVPLESSTGDSSVTSHPVGAVQSFMDLDGDGYPDSNTNTYATYAPWYDSQTQVFGLAALITPDPTKWAVFRNDGTGQMKLATDVVSYFPYPFPVPSGAFMSYSIDPPAITDVPSSVTEGQGLLDFNGDGLPDRWSTAITSPGPTGTYAQTQVSLNHGAGFVAASPLQSSLHPSNDGWEVVTSAQGVAIGYQTKPPPKTSTVWQGYRFATSRTLDVDLDGRLDLVKFRADTDAQPGVCFNEGGDFATEVDNLPNVALYAVQRDIAVHGTVNSTCDPSSSPCTWEVLQDMVDINGDGIPEGFDFGSQTTNNNQLYLSRITTPTQPPRLLTRVDNGRGLHTDIAYTGMSNTDVVTQTPATGKVMPHTQWVVSSIASTDVLANTTSTTNYQYTDPEYNADDEGKHSFRGFDTVTATLPSGAVRVDHYAFDRDWSGRLVQTVMRPSAGTNEARAIDNTTWESRGLFGTLCVPETGIGCTIVTYHAVATEHLTCSNGQSDDPTSLQPCTSTTAAGYLKTSTTWTKKQSTTSGDSTNLLWLATTTLEQGGTSNADGDRQTVQDYDIATNAAGGSDGGILRVRPTKTTKQVRNSGAWSTYAQSRTTWTNDDRTAEYEDVWFDATGDLNACTSTQANCGTTHRVFDAAGNVTDRTKPKQYSASGPSAHYNYDSRKLFVSAEFDEPAGVSGSSMELDYTWEYGTGTKLLTEGPNIPTCANTTPDTCLGLPKKEQHKIRVDGLGRTIERLGSWFINSSTYPQYSLETFAYNDTAFATSGAATSIDHHQATDIDQNGSPLYAEDITEIDGHGRPIKKTVVVAPTNQVTTFTYRGDGTLSQVNVPDPTQNNTSTVAFTYSFDSLGRPTSIRRPDSSTDPSGADITYDGLSATTSEHVGASLGQAAVTTTLKDSFGRLKEVDEQTGNPSAPWATTSYEYGPDDNVTKVTDPEEVITTMTHDFAGRRTSITRDSRSWSYQYDKNGNMVAETVPGGTSLTDPNYITTTAYDDLDRPVSRFLAHRNLSNADLTLFGADHEALAYDNSVNRRGHLFWWAAYAPGASGPDRTLFYQLLWDAGGMPYQTQETFKADTFNIERDFTLDHTFNGVPRLARYTDSIGGTNVTYGQISVDARGLPSNIRLTSTDGLSVYIGQATRNVAGLVTQQHTALTGGTMTSIDSLWTYDKLGRVVSQVVQKAPSPTLVAQQDLTYFGNDDPATLDQYLGSTNHKTFNYAYDLRHQLLTASATTANYFSGTYGYRASGRFDTASVHSTLLPPNNEIKVRDVSYEYPASPPPAGYDREEVMALVQGAQNVANYDYDAVGNQTVRCMGTWNYTAKTCTGGDYWTFLYDGKDQLRRASHFNSANVLQGSEEYWYEPNGNRTQTLKRDGSGNKTELIFWNGDVEAHYDGTGNVTHIYSYLNLGTSVARVDRTGNTTTNVEFLFHGLAGSTLAAVDKSSGTVNASYSYGPFGEVIEAVDGGGQQGFASNRRRFNSKYVDEVSDLTYYGARYYDRLSMTWTQSDPMYRLAPEAAWTQPRRANLFTFNLNNPVRYVDADGHAPWLAKFAGAPAEKAADVLGMSDNTLANNATIYLGGTAAIDNLLTPDARGKAVSMVDKAYDGDTAGAYADYKDLDSYLDLIVGQLVVVALSGGRGTTSETTFDAARVEAFKNAGILATDDVGMGQKDTRVDFSKSIVDPKTGTMVSFEGENGGKVSYDSEHPASDHHPKGDPQHVHYAAPKSAGGKKDKIYYHGPPHPGRPAPSVTKAQRQKQWTEAQEAEWMRQQSNMRKD